MSTSQQLASDEYANIKQQYVESKKFVWRKHIEEHTAKQLLLEVCGSRVGKPTVLELACGAGHYSNKIVNEWSIADRILATDLSPDMIELARATYYNSHCDDNTRSVKMRFEVADACCQRQLLGHKFDIVFAAYLINYCSSYDMLLAMCRTIRMNLSAGGSFISINDGSRQAVSSYTAIPGFTKLLHTTSAAPAARGAQFLHLRLRS